MEHFYHTGKNSILLFDYILLFIYFFLGYFSFCLNRLLDLAIVVMFFFVRVYLETDRD